MRYNARTTIQPLIIITTFILFCMGADCAQFHLPDTPESEREYKAYCLIQHHYEGECKFWCETCIERQEEILDNVWSAKTDSQIDKLKGAFSYCIGTNRILWETWVEENGEYHEQWLWDAQGTFDCMTRQGAQGTKPEPDEDADVSRKPGDQGVPGNPQDQI